MASKIKVDQLETADGSGTIALQNQLSGLASASMPTGSVLQVVGATRTNTENGGFLLNTTSNSYVNAGLSVAITPSSTSSKIMIFVNTSTYRGGNASLTIYRGSTNLGGSTHGMIRMTGAQGYWMPVGLSHLDSPSTTSATTYYLFARSESGTNTYVGGDADMQNNITVMEIAG
tara:strand:+ start:159 stop:680 length:522 start_codon:yes stop_codon:yes gene_type:complete